MASDAKIRALVIADYDPGRQLWEQSEGVGLNESDTPEAIAAFLFRNPGLSLVTQLPDGRIIGAVLCGHDGRRGYLHHLAVSHPYRGQGHGSRLVESCLALLRAQGVPKCNIFLFATNTAGRAFWLRETWVARDDLLVMQHGTGTV